MRGAEGPLFRFVTVFVDHVKVRLNAGDFRLRIHPAMPCRDQGPVHVPNRVHHVNALLLAEKRMSFTLQQPDVRVMSHDGV